MPTRSYVSPSRSRSTAETRANVLLAATEMLRRDGGIAVFSLDAVGKAAGVTRLTVYNQFGSRRGLLEAVMEDVSRRGGIARLGEVLAVTDPLEALDQLVEIFSTFWASDAAIGRIFDAMAVDDEIAEALAPRFNAGRSVIAAIIERLLPAEPESARQDAADMIHALTDLPVYRSLCTGRTIDQVRILLQKSCRAIIR
jgi:AcrR family transcriptional regulator